MTATRVHYRERQLLRSNDLTDEQNYRLVTRRRHNIAHHGWGIVTGLVLEIGPDCPQVQPGMAVDGYGRELIVPALVRIPVDKLDELMREDTDCTAIDVWLLYARVATTPPQRGRWECGPGQHSRWREQADLRLTSVKTTGFVDPRQPPVVPAADLDFGAHETSPDDPQREWPVYLGRIARKGSGAYAVIPSTRPYATLVGETVAAPSGLGDFKVTEQSLMNLKSAGLADEALEKLAGLKNDEIVGEEEFLALLKEEIGDELLNQFGQKILAQTRDLVRMQVGSELRGDRRRFAVSLSGGQEAYADQLSIERAGSTTKTKIRGNTALEGELSIGSLRFRTTDLSDPTKLIERLRDPEELEGPLVAYLLDGFSEETRQLLGEYDGCSPPSDLLCTALVEELNQRLYDDGLYQQDRFPDKILRPATRTLIELLPQDVKLVVLNRLLLEDAFPHELNRSQADKAPPWGVEFGSLEAPPPGPAPWQIYHAQVSEEDNPTISQLRMEIEHPGDRADPSNYRLVIGHREHNGAFVPCLSVAADCTVTVHETAKLVVEGKVIESPIGVDPDDPRFNEALLESWRDALAKATTDLDLFYRPLEVELAAPMAVSADQEEFNYTITVRNIGKFMLSVVRIAGIADPLGLNPGQAQPVSRTFQIQPDLPPGEIVIESKATSIGPFGNPVEASAKSSVFYGPLQVELAAELVSLPEGNTVVLNCQITLWNLSTFPLSNAQVRGQITGFGAQGEIIFKEPIDRDLDTLEPGKRDISLTPGVPSDLTSGEIVIQLQASGYAPDNTSVVAAAQTAVPIETPGKPPD
jgi:hypothetical protein